jgi:hypothetical protein
MSIKKRVRAIARRKKPIPRIIVEPPDDENDENDDTSDAPIPESSDDESSDEPTLDRTGYVVGSIWGRMESDDELIELAMRELRFDLTPEYFKRKLQLLQTGKFDYYDDKKMIPYISQLYADKLCGVMKMPPVCDADILIIKFANSDGVTAKTLKTSRTFITFHAPVVNDMLGDPLLTGTDAITFNLISRKTFKLVLRILYNPGLIKTVAVHLFRTNILHDLLGACSILGIEQVRSLIDTIFFECMNVYIIIRDFYNSAIKEDNYERTTDKDIVRLTTMFEQIKGKYAMIGINEIIDIMDVYKLYESMPQVFSALMNIDTLDPNICLIIKDNDHLSPRTYTSMIEVLMHKKRR